MAVHFYQEGEGHLFGCPDVKQFFGHGCPRCQKKTYSISFLFSLLAAWVEWRGSKASGSLSLFADAIHVLGDGLGYLLGFFMLIYARTRKKQILFLLALGALLLWSAGNIFLDGINRILHENTSLKEGMFRPALFGLVVNGAVLWLLSQVQASHVGHEHRHHTFEKTKETVLRANIIHTFGDLFSSLAVVSVGSLLLFWPESEWIRLLDPAIAILISGLLLWQAWVVFRSLGE